MPEPLPPLDCREAMRRLWDYVDAELSPETMAAVGRHLTQCAECHPHAEFAERFLAALHATRAEVHCPSETRARVMDQLREAGMTLD